ncbi:MAG: hypothetical protein JWL93_1776 [Hyphomicrobiales bacterium]|nr:hypothetical protein [Hyphomicrobiales bacterium]
MSFAQAGKFNLVGCLLASTAMAVVTLPTIARAQAPSSTPAVATSKTSQPADLCVELSAYVPKETSSAKADETTGASPGTGTAVQAPKAETEQPKVGGTDNAQQTSGLSAPITKEGTGASGPQGDAQEAAKSAQPNPKPDAQSGSAGAEPKRQDDGKPMTGQQSAAGQQSSTSAQTSKPPAPPSATAKAPPPTSEALRQAKTSISSKDQTACRAAIQTMRRAGVALPAPLIALGALDPKLFRASAAAPASGENNGAGAPGASP